MKFPIDVEFYKQKAKENCGFTDEEATLMSDYLKDLNEAFQRGVQHGLKQCKDAS
ncbi:hypothetical protein [uncultured Allofournierella sp.]|uniref:hypothetical protein n=1 Tax=uncultured Allofournierella sp. TaxID=1940258 RepID=UPI00375000BF